MAYNDEAVRAKLSTLNETQESIVTVAQWMMFHRRHSEQTANLWLEKLKDSNANKRLNLLYLANEVVQQSKIRKRDDFLVAFSPLMAEATSTAFRGAHSDVRQKIKRVVEVWRSRTIFDSDIQGAVEARIAELEKNQSSGAKKLLGGSLFSGSSTPGPSAPEEIKPLIPLQENVNKATMGTDSRVEEAGKEYNETVQGAASLSAPVQVAKYSRLFKILASAENVVSESVKARESLLAELEKLVESNRSKLEKETRSHAELSSRRAEIEIKRREVEDVIMKGFASVSDNQEGEVVNGGHQANEHPDEPERPMTEELTPPPVENITPVESPEFQPTDIGGNVPDLDGASESHAEAGADLLASLSRPFSSTDMAGEEVPAKRQRTDDSPNPQGDMYSSGNVIPGLSNDVDDLIRSEGKA